MERRNTDVLGVLLNWKSRGREEGKAQDPHYSSQSYLADLVGLDIALDARRLIEMPLEDAANWIDLNLPPPPNAESLTGIDEPPPRPSHLPSPPLESPPAAHSAPSTSKLSNFPSKPFPSSPQQPPTAPAKMRSDPRWTGASTGSPPPPRPASPRRTFVETSLSNWTSRPLPPSQPTPRIPNTDPPATRLNLSYMPVNFEQSKFVALFEKISIPFNIILYRVSNPPTYAFVDVNANDAAHAIRELHGISLGRCWLRCMVATSRNPDSPLPVRLVASPRPQGSPPIDLKPVKRSPRPPSSVSRTASPPRPNTSSRQPIPVPEIRSSRSHESVSPSACIIFNLPLDGSSRRGPAAQPLSGDEVRKFPQHDQSCFIPATRGLSAADRFERLWDGYLLEGRRLEVVRVKRGVTVTETIEEYFSRSSSAPSTSPSHLERSSTALHRSRSRSVSPRRWRRSR